MAVVFACVAVAVAWRPWPWPCVELARDAIFDRTTHAIYVFGACPCLVNVAKTARPWRVLPLLFLSRAVFLGLWNGRAIRTEVLSISISISL